MGHEDNNMALDVYSGGLAIEPLRKSMSKLSYGEEMMTKNIATSFDTTQNLICT